MQLILLIISLTFESYLLGGADAKSTPVSSNNVLVLDSPSLFAISLSDGIADAIVSNAVTAQLTGFIA